MDTIVKTITEVLTDLAENGVPKNMVDAALH